MYALQNGPTGHAKCVKKIFNQVHPAGETGMFMQYNDPKFHFHS